ncbi:TPA: hypothetical protein DEP21_05295 [Patescibacteria group bacterium]|nr:hypothetical protein [Candidatus Gracilibacteria bacterium]
MYRLKTSNQLLSETNFIKYLLLSIKVKLKNFKKNLQIWTKNILLPLFKKCLQIVLLLYPKLYENLQKSNKTLNKLNQNTFPRRQTTIG